MTHSIDIKKIIAILAVLFIGLVAYSTIQSVNFSVPVSVSEPSDTGTFVW